MTLDDFLNRLAAVESGGNPNALNKDSGAFGLFQILPSNWPTWAKQAGVDPNDKSAAAQRKVAAFEAQRYFNGFGSWEAVAVAWYAGPAAAAKYARTPNDPMFTKPQGQYPSIGSYVTRVMGATPTTAAPSGGQTTVSAQAATPPADPSVSIPGSNDLVSTHGWAAALADIPEMKQILDQAVAEHWTQEKITAAVMGSQWYHTHNQRQIQWEIEKRLHPADAAADANTLKNQLRQQAIKDGFPIDDARLDQMVNYAKSFGLDDTLIPRLLHNEYHFDPHHAQGGAATLQATLKQTAKSYFVPLSDQAISAWVEGIMRGDLTQDSFTTYVRDQAKSMYPNMAASIDSGVTTQQYADPYIQIASNELGVNPNDIDMTDPKWSAALMQTDPKTGQRTSMSLDQWRTLLRTDPKYGWGGTSHAGDMAAGLANDLLRGMGAA